jgi:serine protease Do
MKNIVLISALCYSSLKFAREVDGVPMKLAYKIGSSVAGMMMYIFLWQPNSFAKSVAEIGQIAKSTTVLIQGSDTGSGVLIRQDGSTYTILTARHVIDAPGTYEVVTVTGKHYPISPQIQKLPGLDLALLKFNSPETYSVATLGNSSSLQEGVTVYVTGFPGQGSTINALTYNFTEGQLTAFSSKPQTGGYSLVYTNKTLPGMSGGPVFDQEARLVGIHGAADGQSQTLEKLNARVFMKTGFNLGIPINTFVAASGTKDTQGQIALATPNGREGSSNSNLSLQSAPRTSNDRPPATKNGRPTQIASASEFNSASSDYFLAAMNQYLQDDLTGALRSSTRAIQINPRFAAAYSLRGSVRYLTQDYSGAIADFSQAVQLDSNLASAYLGRGLSQSAMNNPDGALSDYTKAIQLSPDSLSYYNRGVVQLNQGNRAAAQEDLQKSADIALMNNNRPDYDQAMEALKIAGRNCQQSINKICDR